MLSIESLKSVPVFHDLPEQDLHWLAEQGEEVSLNAGDCLFREGEPAESMFAILEGEVLMERKKPDENYFKGRLFLAGDVTGFLPYSRLETFSLTGEAISPSRVGVFHKRMFPEMLARMPKLGERLVGLMTDRVREVARIDEQQRKLASLGKLSAGLAHELNNPAGAAKRAATSLREIRPQIRDSYIRLDIRELEPSQREFIARFEDAAMQRAAAAPAVSSNSLDQADREEELLSWMDSHGVLDAHQLSGSLAESAVTIDELEGLAAKVGIDAMSDVLTRMHLVLMAARLISEIEQSTSRISEIVKAVKEYTFMDQAPEQEIDIHEGIESTLTILAFKLRRKSITVTRQFDRTLPRICAFGAELNQVWTNLFVNAIEAMEPEGELHLRTSAEGSGVLVEVRDNGPGIPKEIQPRIFEAFFTTKKLGDGTGIGLETVQRIVRKHLGQISVESKPGDTRFLVHLPKNRRPT